MSALQTPLLLEEGLFCQQRESDDLVPPQMVEWHPPGVETKMPWMDQQEQVGGDCGVVAGDKDDVPGGVGGGWSGGPPPVEDGAPCIARGARVDMQSTCGGDMRKTAGTAMLEAAVLVVTEATKADEAVLSKAMVFVLSKAMVFVMSVEAAVAVLVFCCRGEEPAAFRMEAVVFADVADSGGSRTRIDWLWRGSWEE